MEVTVWNDYVCPWAYAARPHTRWLRSQGAEVWVRSYELHPDLPPGGRPVRPGGRLDRVLDHLAAECAAHDDLPFVKPTRTPSSRRSLELFEVVSEIDPERAAVLDERLARAHWADGLALDDPAILDTLLEECVSEDVAAESRVRWAEGHGARRLERARVEAHEAGVTATPSWRIGELTITGLHPPEQFRRWTGRLLGIDG